jgi:hypothetical protein
VLEIQLYNTYTISMTPERWQFWKDADPNIPILKEAKAEYAKLQ